VKSIGFWSFFVKPKQELIFFKIFKKLEVDILQLNLKTFQKFRNKAYQGKLNNYPTFQISLFHS